MPEVGEKRHQPHPDCDRVCGQARHHRPGHRYRGQKSTVMMFGLTRPDEEVAIKPFQIFKKEVVQKASFINPYTQGRALALIASGRVDVSSMVSTIAPLEQLPQILADDRLRKTGKVIIRPTM